MQIAGRDLTPINDLTNKAVLGLGAIIGTGLVGVIGTIMWLGARSYVDGIYVQKVDDYDWKIEFADRRIFEIDEVFMIAGSELDPATSRRLGADKGYYENQKAILLRKRADLRD